MHHTYSQIDFFLLKQNKLEVFRETTIDSDPVPITISFELKGVERGVWQ